MRSGAEHASAPRLGYGSKEFRTRIRNPGIDEHQQNGNAEKSIDVIRNLANVLLSQARTKIGITVPVSHPLFACDHVFCSLGGWILVVRKWR